MYVRTYVIFLCAHVHTHYAGMWCVCCSGDYPGALRHFEEGLTSKYTIDDELREACNAGVARTSIKTGDIHR